MEMVIIKNMELNEEFRDIEGYEGKYQISNLGRIKSLPKERGHKDIKILIQKVKKTGYHSIGLCKDGKVKYFHVHRLVGKTFIPNPENKPDINHVNCIKSDNRLENLEWVTSYENNKHARENIVFNTTNTPKGETHVKSLRVGQYDDEWNLLSVWACMSDIGRYYNLSTGVINNAIDRGTGKSIGYKWKIISDDEYNKFKDKLDIPKLIVNPRTRDTSKANQSRIDNLNKISNEFIIEQGVKCYMKYGNVYRNNMEEYARDNNVPGYGMIRKRFGEYKNYTLEVMKLVSNLHHKNPE